MNLRVPLLLLLLPIPLLGQSTVRGLVTEQNSGNRPIPGVQIKALGSAPELSDNAGAFRLAFPGKKPGERVIVSAVTKQGYEIVNRDALAGWLIPADPAARTKIVMCPEGTLARNILKYYDISLDALTRGYNEQLRRLQAQRDSARIDARAYGEQAKILADRFQYQQTQLEELAERFARENFDDCSDVQRRAFAAFSAGNVDGAIRILETVNSAEELAKAKAQEAKAGRLAADAQDMLAESRRVVQQHVEKLLFQGDLCAAANRFEDAAQCYHTAVMADSTRFATVSAYARYLTRQHHFEEAMRWWNAALAAARTAFERATAIGELGQLHFARNTYAEAERRYEEALAIFRAQAAGEPDLYLPGLATTLDHLAMVRIVVRRYEQADTNVNESLAILRTLVQRDSGRYRGDLADCLATLAMLQHRMNRKAEAEELQNEVLSIRRARAASGVPDGRHEVSSALDALAAVQFTRSENVEAGANLRESLAIARELAASNPDAHMASYSTTLHNLALVQTELGQIDSAEANHLVAIAILERMVDKNPQVYTPSLAASYRALGIFYSRQHRPERAVRSHTAEVALSRVMAEADPDNFTFDLILNLWSLGAQHQENGSADSAEALFAEALERARAATARDSSYYAPALAFILLRISWQTYPAQLARAMAYLREAIGIYQRLPDRQQNNTYWMGVGCGHMARYLLLAKRFEEAETYARMHAAIDSAGRLALKNLAHSLLYQGNYEEAKRMYLDIRSEVEPDGRTIGTMILADFDEFEKAGVTHPDIERIRALLTTNEEPRK